MPKKSQRRYGKDRMHMDDDPQSVRKTRAERMVQDPHRNSKRHNAHGSVKGGHSGGRSLFSAERHHLYGLHPVVGALLNPARRNDVLFTTVDGADRIAEKLQQQGHALNDCVPTVMHVDKHALNDSLPEGAVHQGMILLTDPLPRLSLDEMILGWEKAESQNGAQNIAVAVLDQVTDPHNVGAILRSASVFGISAVILPDRHAPQESAVLAKSASGAVELVPLISTVNLNQALDKLKEAGFWTVGFAGETEQHLHDLDLKGRIALIMGAEGTGMRRLTRENCDFTCKIPMTGLEASNSFAVLDSLNVSNAAAIAFYEWAKTGI